MTSHSKPNILMFPCSACTSREIRGVWQMTERNFLMRQRHSSREKEGLWGEAMVGWAAFVDATPRMLGSFAGCCSLYLIVACSRHMFSQFRRHSLPLLGIFHIWASAAGYRRNEVLGNSGKRSAQQIQSIETPHGPCTHRRHTLSTLEFRWFDAFQYSPKRSELDWNMYTPNEREGR